MIDVAPQRSQNNVWRQGLLNTDGTASAPFPSCPGFAALDGTCPYE